VVHSGCGVRRSRCDQGHESDAENQNEDAGSLEMAA